MVDGPSAHSIEHVFVMQAGFACWAGEAVTPRRQDVCMYEPREITTPSTLTIDCATCSQRDTSTCDDCMVTFLCGRDPGDAVVVDLGEFRAMRVLGESGLVRPLRHTSST